MLVQVSRFQKKFPRHIHPSKKIKHPLGKFEESLRWLPGNFHGWQEKQMRPDSSDFLEVVMGWNSRP